MLLTEIRTDVEYEFLELWYSCKWVIWDRYPESIFMVSEGEVLFEQDWKNNYLFCKYSKVWSLFESKFEYNNMQINDMISGILEEHLKNGVLTPHHISFKLIARLEEHLKNGVLTPVDSCTYSSSSLEEHLKNGVLTPKGCLSMVFIELEEHLKNGVLTPRATPAIIGAALEEHLKNGVLTPSILSYIDNRPFNTY